MWDERKRYTYKRREIERERKLVWMREKERERLNEREK